MNPSLPDPQSDLPQPQPPFDAISPLPDPFPTNGIETQPIYMGKNFQFKFHGQAMEYFGIWIVNILLTIATLSLYAPWAKVRRLRYFYSHTEFFERFFDFTGVPTKILIGRLIALSIWGAFAVASALDMSIAAFGGLLIYLALPWLIRATLRFNARNSKFANSRFYFSGTTKDAYKQFFLALLITIFTLGIFSPVVIWLYKRYMLNHLYVGQLKFNLNNEWSSYMRAVYVPVLMFIALMLVLGIFTGLFSTSVITTGPYAIMGSLILVYAVGLLFVGPLIRARIFILTWNSTELNQSKFSTNCNQWHYAWIVASNWIVTLFSLGLLSPWAAIRLYRYQVESLTLTLNDDPNLMMNIAQQDHSAIAEEISDIFDLDISL